MIKKALFGACAGMVMAGIVASVIRKDVEMAIVLICGLVLVIKWLLEKS